MKKKIISISLIAILACLPIMSACASKEEAAATSSASSEKEEAAEASSDSTDQEKTDSVSYFSVEQKGSGNDSTEETIYQVALLQSLVQGYYDGIITVGELKEHGDIGIGTFEGVNGEMIVLDGVVYQALADGSIATPSDEETIPFSNVTFFDEDETLGLSGISDMAALQAELNAFVENKGKNLFYMVRIDGKYPEIMVRSEYKQEKPYRMLDEALASDQTEFKYENAEGTIVGLYCPDYMGGLNNAGWHFHYISQDLTRGGHVLQVSIDEAAALIDITDGFEMELPEETEFQEMDLAKNVDEALHKAETAVTSNTEQSEAASDANVYSLASVHQVNGRQGVCAEGSYYWVSGSTTLTKYDENWNVVAENTDPFKGYELEVNHIGDIDVYQNELYLGVEYFMDGVGKNIQVAVYDGDTLELKRVFPFSDSTGQLECSGIAVDPDSRTVYMVSWIDDESSNYLYMYDLDTGDFKGKILMENPPKWLQGVAYYNGSLYVTCDDGDADNQEPDHMYRIDVNSDSSSGTVSLERTFDDVVMQGEIEGLCFDKERDQFLLLYNHGARIVLGMPKGFYDGFTEEIHEVYVYDISAPDTQS